MPPAGLSPAPPLQGAPPVLPPGPGAGGGSERSLYQRGQSFLKQRRYNQAAAVFSQMLGANPGGALAPNARYWLGECHYALGQYREAAMEFDRCAADYPQSAKAPDSLLKLSYSYDRLGDGPRAMAVLNVLLSRYPSSSAAAMIKSGRGRFS
jgi:tol-pal system protein YbgF